jgi:hypothetical protein
LTRPRARRFTRDVDVGELQRVKAIEDHSVHPFSVALHLQHSAVKSISEKFDNDLRAWKATVNANETLAAPTNDLLGLWPGKSGLRRQLQEPSLQPGMAAPGHLASFEHSNEPGEPGASAPAQRNDSAVEEVLAGQAVAQRAIDCGGEPFDRLSCGEVDDCPGGRDRWDTIDKGGVEPNDVATPMHHVTDSGH